eukprot:6752-Chlamydomonas_euryale.AAC.1
MDFRRQRADLADMLEDAAGVVGFGRTLALLLEPLHRLSADVAAGQPFDWRAAEAALFCVRSVAYHAPHGPEQQLLGLLRALPGLPPGEPQLRYTACHVVSQYAPWLAAAAAAGAAEPDLAQRLVTLAVDALAVGESAGAVRRLPGGWGRRAEGSRVAGAHG